MSVYATAPSTNFIYCDNCRLNNYLSFCFRIDNCPGIYCSLCFEKEETTEEIYVHTKMILTVMEMTSKEFLPDHYQFIQVKNELLYYFNLVDEEYEKSLNV